MDIGSGDDLEGDTTVIEGAAAETLRECGNALFKEKQFADAATCYREALMHVRKVEGAPKRIASQKFRNVAIAVRLNLAGCLVRIGEDLEEAIQVCNEALEAEPGSAKALFRRGAAFHCRSQTLRDRTAEQREALQAARRDLVEAGRLEHSDKQVRALLAEVQEALRGLSEAAGGGLRGSFLSDAGGLYEDRQPAPPSAPAPTCSTCGRVGHPCCGKAWWVEQRARWLDVGLVEVGREPRGFEDEGSLAEVVRRARGRRARAEPLDIDSEISDGERATLEACLEATERPYPQPRQRLPLEIAVQCATELWADA